MNITEPKKGITSRGVWTWGHVIYDYRGFLRNMARMGLDKIVIWNDFAPLNAREIMDFAHSLGIKVVWGFAWGWIDGCDKIKSIDDDVLERMRGEIIAKFDSEYREICGDGIYFQSFTELGSDTIGGRCVAETVTSFVNSTAEYLFAECPELEIEFGLHATSVRNHLDKIAMTDPRIRIVWEDCGSFPYAYNPTASDGFDETLEFTKKLLSLRGRDEKCGIVVKSMTNLDWSHFEHQKAPFILGEYTADFIKERAAVKAQLWENRTEGWLKNLGLLTETLRLIDSSSADAAVEGLIEDGMLEYSIPLPAALYASAVSNPYADDSCLKDEARKIMY